MENPPKRKETDLISNLPDHLILRILSLVPIKDVITTTPTLSKRWQNLWTCLPSLRFTSLHQFPSLPPFLTFINHVLLHSTPPTIHKLFIQLPYYPNLDTHFNQIVKWALAKNVRKLLLDFQPLPRHVHGYVPQPFFGLGLDLCNESSLKTLFISKCRFPETGVFSFRFLTRLTMSFVVLDDGVMENLLAGSPVLERLELISFYGFRNLCIMNRNLKRLMLVEYWVPRGGSRDNNVLTITAPYILELEISGFMFDLQLRLVDVSSLVSAKIDFDITWTNDIESERYDEWLKVGKDLLQSVAHVKELMLGKWLLQVLSVLRTQSFSYSLSNCKGLTLNSCMSNFEVPSVISLLNSSPQLETLIIHLDTYTDYFNSGGLAPTYHDSEKFLNSQDQIIKCLALHLKTVKIGSHPYCCMKWEVTKQWKKRNSDPTLPSNKYDLEYLLSEEELHNNGVVDHRRLLLKKLVSCKETFRRLIFGQDMCCKLLEFLLMNGKFLEKLVITSQREVCHICSTCCAFEYLSLVAEKLSTVPRSSAGAVIKFVEKQP